MIEKICQTCAMWNSLDCLIKLPDFGCEKWHRNKLTNGDRIRQMTDEELVESIGLACKRCAYYKVGRGECSGQDKECTDGNLAWLKQEAIICQDG